MPVQHINAFGFITPRSPLDCFLGFQLPEIAPFGPQRSIRLWRAGFRVIHARPTSRNSKRVSRVGHWGNAKGDDMLEPGGWLWAIIGVFGIGGMAIG
jgi:hypothetical protein